MRKIWLLAIAAALLSTACRIETNILINLNEDETGSFGFEFGMDEEFRALIAEQGEPFGGAELFEGIGAELFEGIGAELPGGIVTERTEGDMTFSLVTVDFDGAEAFQQLIAEGAGTSGDIDVTWTDDSVSITATLEGTGEDGGILGDLGGAAGGDLGGDLGGDFDFGLSGFADNFFSGSVIVSMPGTVGTNNADRVLEDGRLVWDLSLDGGNIEIQAVSDLGGGSIFPAWAVLILVLVALAILLWLYSMQRKRKTSAVLEGVGDDSSMAAATPADWSTPPEGTTPDDGEPSPDDTDQM